MGQKAETNHQSAPSATLFGELRSRLSKDAWAAVKVDTLERTVFDMFSCVELFSKMQPCKSSTGLPDLR